MTSIVSRCFVIRPHGSGKLCVDSKIDLLSASLSPMKVTGSRVFGHPERLSASFFAASPDRFALRNPITLV
jgi:hypothetical protein